MLRSIPEEVRSNHLVMSTQFEHCVISDFRREVDENCAPLEYYAAASGNFLPTFRNNLSVPSLNTEDGTDKKLPVVAA
jgi:hypothetical protein